MFIVFDLEATCWATAEETEVNTSEIIQIGAVRLDLYKKRIVDKFNVFVRPKHSKELSEYCINLTGITNEDVKTAEYFEQAYPKFVDFCGSKYLNTLVAWGAYDGRKMAQTVKDHELEYKLPAHYINASALFKEKHGLKFRTGLANALKYFKIEPIGTQHDGFYDALNAARVFTRIMGINEELGNINL